MSRVESVLVGYGYLPYKSCRVVILACLTLSTVLLSWSWLSPNTKSLPFRAHNCVSQYPKALITVHTIPDNYGTRVKHIRDTWGLRVNDVGISLAFVGGNATDHSTNMYTSICPLGPTNVCCKVAYDLIVGWDVMKKRHELEYLLSIDDDVYVLPNNFRRILKSINHSEERRDHPNGAVYGIVGCESKNCTGLCGGGGYFMHRETLERIVLSKSSTELLIREFMAHCNRCGNWGDIVFSQICKDLDIDLLSYPEKTHVWGPASMEELNKTFNVRRPLPWLYHYPARDHMKEIDDYVSYYRTDELITNDC